MPGALKCSNAVPFSAMPIGAELVVQASRLSARIPQTPAALPIPTRAGGLNQPPTTVPQETYVQLLTTLLDRRVGDGESDRSLLRETPPRFSRLSKPLSLSPSPSRDGSEC